ncbi:MAG: 16S rRNA (adenine(1518)-N(6)/adenine(1519)-N(6))-dimethyltransferase RsmA [Defluviitaleaceae bacterium]|nr:16S rRNA (adenine(1518)-N(6)/adenine(1519)-N(6))-dimethyltransferase RsmA [Defluviitaleaceae bacterium]
MREIFSRYGLRAKKKLGQNFLIDAHVLGKIIAAAKIEPGDFVLEIGPGIGGMTQALLAAGANVGAVELDKQLVPILEELFAGENFRVIQGDILKINLNDSFFSKKIAPESLKKPKAVANLPYYITTPVIFALLESGAFESITVMVQKEVARRLSAGPGTKDYGSLSLAVQYHADATLVANVPSNCFMPRPAVDSAVVRLDILPAPRVGVDREKLFKTIHAAFGKRRKTLLNALDSEFACEKTELAEILRACDIDPQTRGEVLNIFEFARLSEALP